MAFTLSLILIAFVLAVAAGWRLDALLERREPDRPIFNPKSWGAPQELPHPSTPHRSLRQLLQKQEPQSY